jgi:hypothetical protein
MRLSRVVLIFVLFSSGCITQETIVNDSTTITSITTTITSVSTTTSGINRLSLGEICLSNDECLSGCCDSFKGRKKCQIQSFCTCKYLTEGNCQEEDCYWCIDKCQSEPCKECSGYKRCLIVVEGDKNITKVEIAQGGNGSCRYAGFYVNASGNESYCDRNEGKRIYGKCGSPAIREDCVNVYGEHCCYDIAQRRSFHSPGGDEYDLWCFECTRAIIEE